MAVRTLDTWRDRAACRGPETSLFFPPNTIERRDERDARERRAKAICCQCPVREQCLEYALGVGELHGIWGGLNESERRARQATALGARSLARSTASPVVEVGPSSDEPVLHWPGGRPRSSRARQGLLMPDLTPGVPSALSPLVRRIVAPNPGPFTGPGTNTYLVGIDEVAVIDPGPDDAGHVDAIVGAAMRERVRWVVLTHTHADHVSAVRRLVDVTGAEVLAFGRRLDKDVDVDLDRSIDEGDTIEGTEFGLDVLHMPGHAPNHLCFRLEEERVLFTGDTILGGMYSVVNPARGGDMATYVATLGRIERIRLRRICPGHGDVIDEPRAVVSDYQSHRKERERQVLRTLRAGPARINDIVAALYADQDLHPKLIEAAGWQVHAHLLKLKAEGKVTGTSVKSSWKLA